jgi:hypothetical protein
MIETEIISALSKYVNWLYGGVIIVIAEIIKFLSVRQCDKKYVLRFDKNNDYPFNIRVPIVVISFCIGIGIIVFGEETDKFNLFATFCIANTAYDYLFKNTITKIKDKL